MSHYDDPNPPAAWPGGAPPDIETPDPFRRLVAIMARLRGPGGCPWDREQTHRTLQQYLIEEAYEVLDAIEDRVDAKLAEELGDVLLQVVFHAQLAAEEQRFTVDDVCRAICEKLIRRHPHVFGDTVAADSDAVLRNWERIKVAERAREAAKAPTSVDNSPEPHDATGKHLFAGTPRHLPALQRAARIQEKAARVGFDWATLAPVLAKVREEIVEWTQELEADGLAGLKNPHLEEEQDRTDRTDKTDGASTSSKDQAASTASMPSMPSMPSITSVPPAVPPKIFEELGDLLFALVNGARFLRINPEECLQAANEKFIRRFGDMHALIVRDGRALQGMSLEEMDAYWERAKRAARGES